MSIRVGLCLVILALLTSTRVHAGDPGLAIGGNADIHWKDSKPVLRDAEIVFITGLTLLNDTFFEVLERTPRAKYRVLLGRTVPLSPIFFDYGIHLVGSTRVSDASRAIRYAQHGGTSLREAPPGALRNINITNQPALKTELGRLNSL
jgi:hypothetical protein